MAHRALRAVRGRNAAAHPRSAKNSYNKNNPAEAGLQTYILRVNQRLLNFKDLVLALPNIWSFLRFQPDFWLNTAVFLHIRF